MDENTFREIPVTWDCCFTCKFLRVDKGEIHCGGLGIPGNKTVLWVCDDYRPIDIKVKYGRMWWQGKK